MRIAMFAPNITRNSGGAEVYAIRMANVLRKNNEVDLICLKNKSSNDIHEYMRKLCGIDDINIREIDFWDNGRKYIKEISYAQIKKQLYPMIEEYYDLFINCTTGTLPAVPNVKSIHIVNFPLKPYRMFFMQGLNKKYISSYNLFLCNSEFTKSYFERYWNINGIVLYPPIAMNVISETELVKKENYIIAVDRLVKEKKIKEMISAFCEFNKIDKFNYKFVIIGNKDSRELKYYNEILQMAVKNKNIEIYSNVSYDNLIKWYKKAKIFWHAKGYGDDTVDPYRMEHFGMTTVEAMANGCVPIVIDKGGQKEIVDEKCGFKWLELSSLIDKTLYIASNPVVLREFSLNAINNSKKFLLDEFEQRISKILKFI